jgi:hypothetical protein
MSESNEQDYMQSGQEALASGEYNTAQVFFKQAIRVNNANEEAWLLLAKTYPTEPDKARKCYENVLKINPLNAEAQRMIDRIDASTAPASAPAYSAPSSAGTASVNEAPESLRSEAGQPAGRKPLGGPSVNSPKGIDGAPENVNLDYFADFFLRSFKASTALWTGQGDGSAELPTSWWNATVLTVAVGFVTGLILYAISLNFRSFLTIITVIPMVILASVVAVGAGAFLSHWYLRTYREGMASLLDHTMTYVRVWYPASVVYSIVLLIVGLTRNDVMSVNSFLQTFAFSASGLGLVFLIVNAAVAVYSALLLHRHWGRLYPNAGTGLWIAIAIALVVTNVMLSTPVILL